MLDQIKNTVKSAEFQSNATRMAGGLLSFVATVVISNVVNKVIEAGVEAVIEKINNKETAE